MSLDYLNYYADLPNPGYAVLVVGPWGVGKTFQVKQLLADRNSIHVSLYGEPSVAAVHESVLAASMSSGKAGAKQGVDWLTQAVAEIGEQVGGSVGIAASAIRMGSTPLAARLFRQVIDPERLIVFDDLERSSINVKDLTGLINEYVERYQCRVVVIANDDALPKKMNPIREKLFGQTLTVKPDLDGAFESFFRDTGLGQPLSEPLRNIVRSVFERSGANSLRIGRQLVRDVERLLSTLSNEQREDASAVEEIIGAFTAWNVEVREQRLGRHHVNQHSSAAIERAIARMARFTDSSDKSEESDWTKQKDADRRYRPLGVEMLDCPWPRALLEHMLFDGGFPSERIQRELNATPWFQSAAALPAWRVLWWWDLFSGEELVEAAQRIESELHTQVPPGNPGVILHLVSRMLHAAAWELVDMDVAKARELCKRYIDEVLPLLPDPGASYDDSDSYDGLGVCSNDSEVWGDYCDVKKHLRVTIPLVLQQRLPSVANAHLESLSSQGADHFIKELNHARATHWDKHLPYLHTLDADAFVTHWLDRPPKEHQHIASALVARRDLLSKEGADPDGLESGWMKEVCEALRRAAAADSTAAPFRIRKLAERFGKSELDSA